MMNSNLSSNEQSKATHRWFIITLLVVGLLGFLDSTYLTAKHFVGSPVVCTILEGCETVTTSRFATVAQIPVALLGSLYYLAVLLLAVACLDGKHSSLVRFTALLTPIGFLASAWFVYVQAFILRAWCIYCLGSAATSTILFIASLVWLLRVRNVLQQTN